MTFKDKHSVTQSIAYDDHDNVQKESKKKGTIDQSICSVNSEVGTLKKVILHRPGNALLRLTPDNFNYFLFDDVLDIDVAEKEHSHFSSVLSEYGVHVLYFYDLLKETLSIPEAKSYLLESHFSADQKGYIVAHYLKAIAKELPIEKLSSYLLHGLTVAESKLEFGTFSSISYYRDDDFLIPPLPSLYFTRDASAWIFNGVSISTMSESCRRAESVNFQAIYNYHPDFSSQRFYFYRQFLASNVLDSKLEGGDVLVLGDGMVLIGLSERTSIQGIESLARELFLHKQAHRVIVVQLPKKRSCMHLDTVLTQVDRDSFVYYPEIINSELLCWSFLQTGNLEQVQTPQTLTYRFEQHTEDFFTVIQKALSVQEVNWIPTGGEQSVAAQEQWHDANNLLVLKPGVVIGYERNRHTIENIKKGGIQFIGISGSELGRGRGGPRCMSCPVSREA